MQVKIPCNKTADAASCSRFHFFSAILQHTWRRHAFKLLITATLLSVTIIILFIFFQSPTEATYKGLTMSQWVWSRETREKDRALLFLGNNNLPLLVQGLKYEMTKDRRLALYRRLPARLQKIKVLKHLGMKKYYEEAVAVDVMRRLRQRAALPAMPELSQMARSGSREVAQRVIEVLATIGDAGVPGIVAGMSNTNQDVRRCSFGWLGTYVHCPAARKAITNAITDPDSYIRQQAAIMIARGRLHGN
jgi:hypothetical protein